MPFEKGHEKKGGVKKGFVRNKQAKLWAEKKGIPFLIRVAEGKEREECERQMIDRKTKAVTIIKYSQPIAMAERISAAQYIVDQGIGKAPATHNLEGQDGGPLQVTFVDTSGIFKT